jgi:small-conductance mechanosensitive channel
VKRFFSEMNPTLRGFLVIALIVVVVMVLNLQGAVLAIDMLLRIAFFLAIALFLFLVWRERRSDIESWADRSRWVFYAAAALVVIDIGFFLVGGVPGGIGALSFVLVLVICAWSMYRVWRDEHTYA